MQVQLWSPGECCVGRGRRGLGAGSGLCGGCPLRVGAPAQVLWLVELCVLLC
jgi:hypothetical protein